MDYSEFDKLYNKIKTRIDKLLIVKSDEYSRGSDRLHNFKRASDTLGISSESTLVGMWIKHIVSVLDIVDDIQFNNKYPDTDKLEEKIGDSIAYLILLEALIKENKKLYIV